MKTWSGGFDFSQIGYRIMIHAGRSLLGAHFRDFDTFPAPRRGYAIFLACAANEPAKRFETKPLWRRCCLPVSINEERRSRPGPFDHGKGMETCFPHP
jgi:hypothetical protein